MSEYAYVVLESVLDDDDVGNTLLRVHVPVGERLGYEVEKVVPDGQLLVVYASRRALAGRAISDLENGPLDPRFP